MSVPDEGYSRNVLCALNSISTFSYTNYLRLFSFQLFLVGEFPYIVDTEYIFSLAESKIRILFNIIFPSYFINFAKLSFIDGEILIKQEPPPTLNK